MEVRVTVELGPLTLALFTNGLAAAQVQAPAQTKEVKTAEVKEVATQAEEEKPKRTRSASKPKTEDFESLDDDAKLEAIKAEVTKHTKKGKSADIKALLAGFDANRASELEADNYNAFFDAVKRYGAGESVEDIVGLD